MSLAYLQCIEASCGARQDPKRDSLECAACGGLVEVKYDFDPFNVEDLRDTWHRRRLSGEPIDRSGVWRFREMIPFTAADTRIISLSEGSTPLIGARMAGAWAGPVHLTIKHQGNNPTGSFKDLGMTACITRAHSRGVHIVACASTGNTSSSMAAYAARAGIKALLFVPYRQISAAKLAQALDFGALVVEVGDTFDQAFGLLRRIAPELGLYLVNSVNPFRIEGQKTIVAEMLEQRAWRPPDYIIVPGGNLGNASAIGKGIRELHELGFIEKVPRVVVVQAAGASPFHRMLSAGGSSLVPVESPETQATAIRIGHPANWKKALRVLEWTRGFSESVEDEEIFEAKRALAEDGVGCEPASAATVAGLRKLCRAGKIEPHADVVAVLTGNQLKDTDYIMRHRSEGEESRQRLRVEADLVALRRALEPLLAVPA
ncbi:MAG: threonine synthase [Acidobacteriota bacterium]|nr:threonine synthase [Acidobacteriota bacterium]